MVKRKRPATRVQGSKEGGQLRIIAGLWRGRKLPVLEREGLRPTGDRVRETLFNWLQFDLPGAHCLDAFSGSGALGIEALSRGAAAATLLERDPGAARQLQQNLRTLQADNAEVVHTDSLDWLAQPHRQRYDLVFLDPPFRQELVQRCCHLLEQQQWLNARAWIYIESERELGAPPVPEHWHLHREKHTGQLSYRLYRRESEAL